MRRSARLCAFVVGALLGSVAPGLADEATHDCSAPPEFSDAGANLPQLGEKLRAHRPVTIVAIGGLSTAGGAAGSPAFAYPSRLQEELIHRFPGTPITVINKGVPRQTAQEMMDRFPQDVFANDPVLVVWETGTTEAVQGLEVGEFSATLEAGLAALRARHIEVILIDMQYSRRTASVIGFDRYLNAMHRFAELDDVALFRRFEIMRYWSESGAFNFEDVPKSERAELAASVYSCLAQRLADLIVAAAQ